MLVCGQFCMGSGAWDTGGGAGAVVGGAVVVVAEFDKIFKRA